MGSLYCSHYQLRITWLLSNRSFSSHKKLHLLKSLQVFTLSTNSVVFSVQWIQCLLLSWSEMKVNSNDAYEKKNYNLDWTCNRRIVKCVNLITHFLLIRSSITPFAFRALKRSVVDSMEVRKTCVQKNEANLFLWIMIYGTYIYMWSLTNCS